jgi:hypothetical protein
MTACQLIFPVSGTQLPPMRRIFLLMPDASQFIPQRTHGFNGLA